MSTPSATITRTETNRIYRPRPSCTACGAPLIDAVAVLDGRQIPKALACSGCEKLGVLCDCERR